MKNILIFLSGAAIGSVVTWKIIEKKYKDLADEEIESVKETFKTRNERPTVIGVDISDADDQQTDTTLLYANGSIEKVNDEVINYSKIASEYIPSTEEEADDLENATVEVEVGKEEKAIEVIPPEEFGDMGYPTKSWTYYSDFILADENDEIVTDPESIIGDALDHFGEYEDDSVYVRNDNTECEYEILKHEKAYTQAIRR